MMGTERERERGYVCMYVCMYICMHVWSSHIAEYGRFCSWSDEQGKRTFPSPRSRVRIWSRETGLAVPSSISLLILHTPQADSGAYSRNSFHFPPRHPFIYLYHHTPSDQSRVCRVTQLRTNGVHYRQSASTGPVVVKAVPITVAAFASPLINSCAPLVWRLAKKCKMEKTWTGVGTEREREQERGWRPEDAHKIGTGMGTRTGSGRVRERRRSVRNRRRVLDAMCETGETWVEREKNADKKLLVQ